jgi:hypothetical protein
MIRNPCLNIKISEEDGAQNAAHPAIAISPVETKEEPANENERSLDP